MTSALGGGGGPPPKAVIVRKLSKGGCMNLQTRGEGVQKSPNFCRLLLSMAPKTTTDDQIFTIVIAL